MDLGKSMSRELKGFWLYKLEVMYLILKLKNQK